MDREAERELAEFRYQKQREVKLARQQQAKLEDMFANMGKGEQATLNIILKADVQGSVEALRDSLSKIVADEQVFESLEGNHRQVHIGSTIPYTEVFPALLLSFYSMGIRALDTVHAPRILRFSTAKK